MSEHFVEIGHFQRNFDKVLRQRSTTKLGMSLLRQALAMRLPAIIPVSMVVYLGFSSASAMYTIPEIKKVPIDRLFTNLQLRLARNTNDFSVTYDLARLHSMSYATNLAEVDVRRDDKRPYFDYPGSDSGVPLRNSPSARDPQTVKRPEGRAPTPLLRGALNTYSAPCRSDQCVRRGCRTRHARRVRSSR